MKQDFYVDLHCHPSVKPFGRAYPGNINNKDPLREDSIWKPDSPSRRDIVLNKLLTVTRFSQSNFTTLHRGKVKVVIAALNPLEKGFFTTRLGKGYIADRFYNFITEIGILKINYIQGFKNYFKELVYEYKFYKGLDNVDVSIDRKIVRYKLTAHYKDLKNYLKKPDVICVILSIEGGHAFNSNLSLPIKKHKILKNIDKVKAWDHPPFFLTLTHHFYNELGGHARSLFGFKRLIVNQSHGHNKGITDIGKKVIERLLDTSNGRRIYIDIKHMSRQVRRDYYFLLATKYRNDNVPIIVSHGALNGYPSVYDDECPNKGKHGPFWGKDINFFDDEIVKIALSDGIFGLQIDDRIITNRRERIKILFPSHNKDEKLDLRAGLLWNQIQHSAEVLDRNGLDAWGTIAMGTDFDGMVDPPIGFWTWENLRVQLYNHLLVSAESYLRGNNPLQMKKNKSASPQRVLQRIFSGNAMEFLRRYY